MKLLNSITRLEIKDIDLGLVAAGSEKIFDLIIQNDTVSELIDINVEVGNDELTIKSFPKTLEANTEGTIKLIYNPKIDVKRGLKASINITATEIYS